MKNHVSSIHPNTNGSLCGKNITNENQELEVDADDVSLNSFRKRYHLSPKIWDGMKMRKNVRLRLLDIADDFWEFCDLQWVDVKGVIVTGSICNFNWSKYSDIDLHVVVDFSEISDRSEFVQEYFNTKKNVWNEEHEDLRIHGYQVELYVEDVSANTESNGIFDIEANAWKKKPNPSDVRDIGLGKYEIKEKSARLMTKIDNFSDLYKATNNKVKLANLNKKVDSFLNDIKEMRGFGLKRGGENDPLNIVYKVLRRSGYLDKLYDIFNDIYNKVKSIK